jgi:predicted Rossmann-fold nucleotide-binding protein
VRNALIAHADALVAVGGGAGTLSEIALAWVHRRLVIAFRLPGWSGRVADAPLDDRRRFDTISDDRVFGVDTAQEAVAVLRENLDAYFGAA